MEKKIICFIIFLLCSLLGMGCATNANNNSSEKIENLQIRVSGLQKEYKIIYNSDLHIISDVN